MDTPILAGPWGGVTGGGIIMGLWLPPRLWAGGFPTGMKGAGWVAGSTALARLLRYRLLDCGVAWGEGPLFVPQFPSLKNGTGIPVV